MESFGEDEGDYGWCRKHSWSHRNGVCAICLKNCLILLCPDCANLRPCSCCMTTDSSPFSSSSPSISPLSDSTNGVGTVGRISFLIGSEPAFNRSRSSTFDFLRINLVDKVERKTKTCTPVRSTDVAAKRNRWFLGAIFKLGKTKKIKDEEKKAEKLDRSKTVSNSSRKNANTWYSPISVNIFRQSKMAKIAVERLPIT